MLEIRFIARDQDQVMHDWRDSGQQGVKRWQRFAGPLGLGADLAPNTNKYSISTTRTRSPSRLITFVSNQV